MITITNLHKIYKQNVVKQICDSVAILKAGQIIEQGQVNDLVAKPDSLLAAEIFPRQTIYNTSPGAILATIAFTKESANEPILSTLTRRFDVNFNILSGSVEIISNQRVGQFQLELQGAKVTEALQYLHDSGFAVEVH